MDTFFEFINLYGETGITLIAVSVIGMLISLIAGAVLMVFEKLKQPYRAFGLFLAVINLIVTAIRFVMG